MPVSAPPERELKTFQVRGFKGVNLTDARTAIEDTEFYWLENAIPVGGGRVRIVPGREAPIVTVASMWTSLTAPAMFPVIIANQPAFILVGSDGRIVHVTVPTGVVTVIAAAGTFSATAHVTMWRDTTVLIIDNTAGYYQWTPGGGLVVIDATKKGDAIAVFEGRAWLKTANRTIEFTAPATFNDFTAANGAGSTIITDEAFPGAIVHLLSALEQLWIVGPGGIEAISNVQSVTTGGVTVTTFSITNIVSQVGTTYNYSVSSFFRTFVFLTPYGVYAIVGATPQKLSDKLDGLFPLLNLGGRFPSAVTTLYNIFCWVALATYNDPVTATARPILLCFAQGKWFFATDGEAGFISSVLVGAVPQLWAVRKDGSGAALYRLFADEEEPVDYRIQTKLYDFGNSSQGKQQVRIGIESVSPRKIHPVIYNENEATTVGQPMAFAEVGGPITFVGSGPITFVGGGAITFIGNSSGLVLGRAMGNIFGQYIGFTLQGNDPAWSLAAFLMQIGAQGEWQ